MIKFTPATHEDSIKLQMAQAQIERIADYLNEAKRSSEQLMIVQYLSSKIHRLNFRLTDLNRYLLRQDSIQWVVSGYSVTLLTRMFNIIIIMVYYGLLW